MITIIEKYPVRNFAALSSDRGICLCDSENGAFLLIRYPEELEELKTLLSTIDITKVTNPNG